MKKLLIVDDEHGTRESLRLVFCRDYTVVTASDAQTALEILQADVVDLALLDVIMPDMSGVDLLKRIHALYADLPVIMVSASTSIPPVVEAIRHGAYDFVSKPFDVENLRHIVRRAIETSALHRRVEILEDEVSREFPVNRIIGACAAFRRSLDHVRKAADTDATVLLQGESGTGKELAARLLHAQSARAAEPFVAVHCAALPETLLESELFGHEKGAFTNADRQKPGRFELAGSGTLFFDEVGEMPLSTQVKLLRVLQEREFMRIGGTRLIRTNARIVTATSKDLKAEVAAGRFRDDLFYRISVVPVHLPPLRERREDVPLLAAHFLHEIGQSLNAATRRIDAEAMDRLAAYAWPGNVRELRNVIERVLVLHGSREVLTAESLPEEFLRAESAAPAAAGAPRSLEDSVNAYERRMIVDALRRANGIQTHAAELLGTTRRILKYKMEKLQVDGDAFRADAPPPSGGS